MKFQKNTYNPIDIESQRKNIRKNILTFLSRPWYLPKGLDPCRSAE